MATPHQSTGDEQDPENDGRLDQLKINHELPSIDRVA